MNVSARRKLIFIFSLFLIPAIVCAEETYTPTNIWGGFVRRVVEAPSSPGTFYATSLIGIFKSTDGGKTWTRKPYTLSSVPKEVREDGGGFGRHMTNSVAVSPTNANIVIAGDEQFSPIWRSTDGGDTWTWISSLDSATYSKWKRTKMTASSLYDSNIFFAEISEAGGTSQGPSTFYISRDAGATWSATSFALSSNQSITDVLQIPTGANAGRIVITVVDKYLDWFYNGSPPTTGKIYYSGNDASSFTQTSFTEAPCKMTWDSTNNKIWLITSTGKVYSSSDGNTWTDSGFQAGTIAATIPFPYKILYFNGTTPTLLASSEENWSLHKIYKNTTPNFAGAWLTLTVSQAGLGKEIVDGYIPDIVFDSRDSSGNTWGLSASVGGFYYTTNNGTDITESTGINTRTTTFGLKDEATNRIYANAFGRIMYSSNNGKTWNRVFPAIGSTSSASYLIFHPTDANKVFLIDGKTIRYTSDNGIDKFNKILIDFSVAPYNANGLSNLLINSSNPNIMYIGFTNSAGASLGQYLYKSTDAGTTWTAISSLTTHGVYVLAFDPSNPNIIYAGCGDSAITGPSAGSGNKDGLYKSSDAGATWTNIGFSGVGVGQVINVDPDNSQRIWLGVNYPSGENPSPQKMTEDGGKTWVDVFNSERRGGDSLGSSGGGSSETLGWTYNGTDRIFYYKPYLYLGCPGGQIYRSSDYGKTCTKITTLAAEVYWIFKGSLYAASGGGLYSITAASVPKSYSGTDIKVYNYPNPFNPNKDSTTTIRLALPNNANNVTFRIYSLSGDLIAESTFASMQGSYSYGFTWDGKNQTGELCAPGLYFVIVNVDGTIVRHKIVLVR